MNATNNDGFTLFYPVKILSWGRWRGGTDGTFRLMIDWKVEE